MINDVKKIIYIGFTIIVVVSIVLFYVTGINDMKKEQKSLNAKVTLTQNKITSVESINKENQDKIKEMKKSYNNLKSKYKKIIDQNKSLQETNKELKDGNKKLDKELKKLK